MVRTLIQVTNIALGVFLGVMLVVLGITFAVIQDLSGTALQFATSTTIKIEATGDFNTSIARALGEAEAFVWGNETSDLEEALKHLAEAREALNDITSHEQGLDIEAHRPLHMRQQQLLDDVQRVITDLSLGNAPKTSLTADALEALKEQQQSVELDVDQELHQDIANLQRVIERHVQTSRLTPLITFVLLIGLAFVGQRLMQRYVVTPITSLTIASKQLTNDNTLQPVAITGVAELGSLQRSFNTMGTTLTQQSRDLMYQIEIATQARLDAEATQNQLAEQLALVEQQREVIREMSVPILPISNTALVMPLIGALDSLRIRQILTDSLRVIAQSAVRFLIVDVTGVPVIDTQVSQALIQMVTAARLLGTEVILTGVRPEVAQSLVSLGIIFSMKTQSSLREGIAYALHNS